MSSNGTISEKRRSPSYITVDGFRLASEWYVPAYKNFLNYQCKDDDIFLVTYPKCGTTWTHYIIYLIYHDGQPPKDTKDFFMSCPFPEAMGTELIDMMPRPGVIKTHLPFHLTPYSPKAKYIYIVRNPKDCCVSFYHHTRGAGVYDFEDGEFDDYFECFIDGKVDYGDYFESVLSWYEHRNDPNVLMITYEDLKAETRKTTLKIAKFLGEDYGRKLEDDPSLLDKIVENSSIPKMKAAMSTMMKDMTSAEAMNVTPAMAHMAEKMKSKGTNKNKFELVRKGIVGDWRNAMTPDQIRRIDEKTEQKLKDTELYQFWKKIGAI